MDFWNTPLPPWGMVIIVIALIAVVTSLIYWAKHALDVRIQRNLVKEREKAVTPPSKSPEEIEYNRMCESLVAAAERTRSEQEESLSQSSVRTVQAHFEACGIEDLLVYRDSIIKHDPAPLSLAWGEGRVSFDRPRFDDSNEHGEKYLPNVYTQYFVQDRDAFTPSVYQFVKPTKEHAIKIQFRILEGNSRDSLSRRFFVNLFCSPKDDFTTPEYLALQLYASGKYSVEVVAAATHELMALIEKAPAEVEDAYKLALYFDTVWLRAVAEMLGGWYYREKGFPRHEAVKLACELWISLMSHMHGDDLRWTLATLTTVERTKER
ncbi:MAG: hypothetical protein WC045_00130 [Patescibacteria group bacterium]